MGHLNNNSVSSGRLVLVFNGWERAVFGSRYRKIGTKPAVGQGQSFWLEFTFIVPTTMYQVIHVGRIDNPTGRVGNPSYRHAFGKAPPAPEITHVISE